MSNNSEQKLELIAMKEFDSYENMYKIVDFLNKSLKDRQLMFGLSKKNGYMIISIYET